MPLSYKKSSDNYDCFYLTVKNELQSNNIFGVVTEVNILDQCLEENLISEEFHKNNIQRCIKMDKENLNKELFISMLAFVASFESSRKSERIKDALERKKKQGLPIGKPKGAKDTKPRRKRGYLENKNALSKKITKQIEEILLDPGE